MSSENKSEVTDESEVFEIDRIRQLIELMKEHDLSEVDLRHETKRIRMRRGAEQPTFQLPAAGPAAPYVPAVAPAAPATPAAAPPADAAPVEDENVVYVKSPMVGTFYSKPKPESPNFVKIGDHVEPDTVVCLVEAMKMFNEIPAGVSGTIVEMMVKNEEPVDVNKPLFKVKPA